MRRNKINILSNKEYIISDSYSLIKNREQDKGIKIFLWASNKDPLLNLKRERENINVKIYEGRILQERKQEKQSKKGGREGPNKKKITIKKDYNRNEH